MDSCQSMIANFLATFRACPDIIKALWLIIPPSFFLGALKLVLNHRVEMKRPKVKMPPRPDVKRDHPHILPPPELERMAKLTVLDVEEKEQR